MINDINLKSYLTSLYAAVDSPLPAISSNSAAMMQHIKIIDNTTLADSTSFWESCTPPSTGCHFPPTVFFRLSESMWNELRNHLEPALLSCIFNTTSVYHCVPGNRYLQLSVSSYAAPSNPCISKRAPNRAKVSKVECLYRNNWNKKHPLGVSNPVYQESDPVDFSKSVLLCDEPRFELVDILWTIKQKAKALSVDSVLGYCCPIPDLQNVRSMSNLEVLRKLSLVPSYVVSDDRVAWVVSKLINSVLPDPVWRDGICWRRLIVDYLALGRYDTMDVCIPGVDHRVVGFVFKRIVIPLVSYMFYCTDSDALNDTHRIIYVRRPVWDLVVTKASRGLVELLELTEIATTSGVGATVRWLPKKNGLRPVVRQPKAVKDKTKKLLRYLSAIKASESGKRRLGVSAFTREDCLDGLKRISRFRKTDQSCPDQLFYFCSDIQNCFESISFDSLQSAIESFCPGHVQFSSVMVSTHQLGNHAVPVRKRPVVFVRNDFSNLLDQLPIGRQHPVVVQANLSGLSDERWSYSVVCSEIMRIVRGAVYNLTTNGSTTTVSSFKVGNRGLAQGSSFSVLLVSILFGWLDSSVLRDVDFDQTTICRLVDDILCLSWNREQVDYLYDTIVRKEAYGRINTDKLCAGMNPTRIAWAGFCLSPSTNGDINISIRKEMNATDLKPRKSRTGRSSITKYFESSLGRSIAQSCLRMLFDESINSQQCVNENAYRAGQMAAKRLGRWILEKSDPKEDVSNIEQFVKRITKFCRKKFSKKLARIFSSGFLHSFS